MSRIVARLIRTALVAAALVVVALGVRSYFVSDQIVARTGSFPNRAEWFADQLHSHKGKLLYYRIQQHIVGDSGARLPVTPAPTKVQLWSVTDTTYGWGIFGSPEHKATFVDRWHGFNIGQHDFVHRIWRPEFGPIVFRNADGTLRNGNATVTDRTWFVSVPHWFLALALGLWPTLSLIRHARRRRRARAGHCPHCNYDLRAHTAAPNARCPECGHPVTPTAPAASTT